MNYLCQYKNGATITIFAPYDCKNNCKFCVNKKDYKANKKFDLTEVGKSFFRLHNITPSCDVVITGGEPFADLDKLTQLLACVALVNEENKQKGIEPHKVFINTTLPGEPEAILKLINKFADTITGLNISRHVRPWVKVCNDDLFEKLEGMVEIRINTVITDKHDIYNYDKEVYDKYKYNRGVKGFQVREDYTTVNAMNLYQFSPLMKEFLWVREGIGEDRLEQYFHTHLIFKNDFRWNLAVGENISYHKTLPYSSIYCGNTNKEINDIIITPQGEILDDWNHYGHELNLKLYEKRILRPCKL